MSDNYSSILKECLEISSNRGEQYGTVKENLQTTADILRVAYEIDITPRDIALVLAANKRARQLFKPKHDNIVDLINYEAIAEYLS